MNGIISTCHGQTRMRQRGMKNGDVELILACGTQIADEAWLLRDRDVDRAIDSRKREIQRLERLRNRKVVICDSRVVTAYPSRLADQKRALRRAKRNGFL